MVKVSIIVPVYGVEKYIDKCLTSLVNQSLKEIEIIIVNDGSLDNSQKIIDKYVKEYPDKVKSYIKKNGGQGSARNYGIKKAIGKYIGFVDSDDYISEKMYEKLYETAIKKKSDITICENFIVDENYNIRKIEKFNHIFNDNYENILFNQISVCNKLYKKEVIINNNLLFKEKVWYEDLAFSIKTIYESKTIEVINEPLYYYLIRQGSTMNNSNIKKNLEIIDAFNDIIEYFKNNNCYIEDNKKIEFLAIDHIYISTIVRIINSNNPKKDRLLVINKLLKFIYLNFPNYKKNKYIKYLSTKRKIIYTLINLKFYSVIKFIFKIKKGD